MSEQQKVRLRILSRMTEPDGDVHELQNARRGMLARTAEGFQLDYDDEQDGERAHFTLTVEQGRARMKRLGLTSTELHFLPGARTSSVYVTMYGEIPVMIDTKAVEAAGSMQSGEMTLDYDVYVGGEYTQTTRFRLIWKA